MGVMMLRAVVCPGVHRGLSQIENRIGFPSRGLDQDVLSLLANFDFLHPAKHAPRDQDAGSADHCFHGTVPKVTNLDWCRILMFSGEKYKQTPMRTIAGQRMRLAAPVRADKVIE